MKRAVVALLATVSMLGCFPHNAKHRTYAKYAEGGSLLAGIAISAFANTGADCDEMSMMGVETNCRSNAKWLSTAGVTLILAGLIGFVATISTAEDEDRTVPVMTQTEKTQEKPEVKLPAGVTPPEQPQQAEPADGSGSGSGSPEPSGSAASSVSAAPQP